MSAVRFATRLIAVSALFCRNRRGTFAVMFAISASVLLLLLGMGVDYLVGFSFKARWDASADAAALAAVQAAEAYAKANATQDAPNNNRISLGVCDVVTPFGGIPFLCGKT